MSVNMKCYDTTPCIRCFACMVGCSVENRLRLQRESHIGIEKSVQNRLTYLSHLSPQRREFGSFPNARQVTAFHHCNHCEDAPCLEICPVDAIIRRDGKEVVVVQETCIGCSSCLDACPFDVPVIKDGKSYKCHGCYDRVENGLKQSCVSACPSSAMFSGTKEEVLKEAYKRAKLYTEKTGKEHVVYGADEVNSTVGELRWVTIVPKEDLEAYKLDTNPKKLVMSAREAVKVVGSVGSVAIVAGSIGHLIYWLGKRKEKISKGEVEEK